MQNTGGPRDGLFFLGLYDLSKIAAYHAHPQADIIRKRVAVLNFFHKHGYKTTREAFGVSRATIYNWKHALAINEGKLTALAPHPRAPHRRRRRLIDPRITGFIARYRTEHPKVGQIAIKPHLDTFCAASGIKTISAATLGRVIADLKKTGDIQDSPARVSLYAATGNITGGKPRKKRKKLRRKGYAPQAPGDLVQVDSVAIFMDGLKRYIVTAIDLKTRFAFACAYGSLSSLSARDFMEKFRKAAPFEVKRVQTDNGLEFEKYFRSYTEQNEITHFHNYPRMPKSNAYIERFNRTIQEQHVEWHKDELVDPREFNIGLMKYLIWYNTEKPHQGINYRTPMQCVLDSFNLNLQKSNMLRDSTAY